jgi:hypothetical protein
MSEAADTSGRWTSSRETAGGLVNSAAAAEIALRAVVGVMSVRALSSAVREHPWLTLFFATGIGYLAGNGWTSGRGRSRPAVRRSRA